MLAVSLLLIGMYSTILHIPAFITVFTNTYSSFAVVVDFFLGIKPCLLQGISEQNALTGILFRITPTTHSMIITYIICVYSSIINFIYLKCKMGNKNGKVCYDHTMR